MTRPTTALAILALLLAFTAAARAEENPLAPTAIADGSFSGTGVETLDGGGSVQYAVELDLSGSGAAGGRTATLVARTRVTLEDRGEVDVVVRGSFRAPAGPGLTFSAPDVRVWVGQEAPQSIGAQTLILEKSGPDRLTGRVGNETDGWTTLSLARKRTAPAPAPGPGPRGNEGTAGRLPRPALPPELKKRAGLYSLLATVPGASTLTAPEWAKEGVLITWWTGTAIIQNQAGQSTLTPDPNGGLVDPKTGTTYRESMVAGGSGAVGFTQIAISGVSPEVVVMQVSLYLHDGSVAQPSLIESNQILCHPAGCEYWIHPKALAALASQGAIAFAGRRTSNGQSREVVVVRNGNGHTVYDAETGLQVSYSMQTQNTGSETYYDPATGQGQVRPRTGSTLVVGLLRGLRETSFGRLAEAPLPATASAMKGAEFRMTRTFEMDAGGGPATTSTSIHMESIGGGGNWLFLRFKGVTSTPGTGVPPPANVIHAVTMPTEVGCTFLPLDFLRGLTQGRELDRDPITGYVTRVASVSRTPDGRSVVMIAREGPDQRTSFAYDAGTGLMISMDKIERAAGTTTRTQLSVVRTW